MPVISPASTRRPVIVQPQAFLNAKECAIKSRFKSAMPTPDQLQPRWQPGSDRLAGVNTLIQGFKSVFAEAGGGFYQTEFAAAENHLKHLPAFNAASAICTDSSMPALREEETKVLMLQIGNILDEIKRTASAGLKIRLLRDLMSLVVSASMVTVIVNSFSGDDPDSGFQTANDPLRSPVGDWALIGVEGLKTPFTLGLSYGTLKRQHMADEIGKRMTVYVNAVKEYLRDPALIKNTSAWNRVFYFGLQCVEKLRDFSTIFTILNTVIPPARLTLFAAEAMGANDAASSNRGLLRLMGNMSDSTRAISSAIGTSARTALLNHAMDDIKSDVETLFEKYKNYGPDHPHVLGLKRLNLAFSFCTTPLLEQIMSSDKWAADFVRNGRLSSQEALAAFLTERKITFNLTDDGLLTNKAAENAFGQQFQDGKFENTVNLSIRAPYRLWLIVQELLGRPWESFGTWLQRTENAPPVTLQSVNVIEMNTRI